MFDTNTVYSRGNPRSLPLPKRCGTKAIALPKRRSRYALKRWRSRGDFILESDVNINTSLLDETNTTNAGLSENELLQAINYFDEDGLLAFPGIGNGLAKLIIDHRSAIDYYVNLEDLLNVSRFGPKRFEVLVGRPVCKRIGRLSQLLNRRNGAHQAILLSDFQPWKRPAAGIREVWLLSKKSFSGFQEKFSSQGRLVVERIGSYRLVFICEPNELKGRASYIIKKLPKIIRSINYERGFTTAN